MLNEQFYQQDALRLARQLLGCELIHRSPQGVAAGIIVETEAYHQSDEASHSFRGMTKRNAVMFGPGGHAYIYFTYGMHYCFNVVAGIEGVAEAVLIRALEPTKGVELMQERRGTDNLLNLCSGPGKLVQAVGLRPDQNGASLMTPALHIKPRQHEPRISTTPRIGISRATAKPWRFFIADNLYITKHKFNKSSL